MTDLQSDLDQLVDRYNLPEFISSDPISIPHSFQKKQDIEISGLFAALFAWGRRDTAISKAKELMTMMWNEPHRFVLEHDDKDLIKLSAFKHRTFQATDTLYFIHWLKWYYQQFESLEDAFIDPEKPESVKAGLIYFHEMFFSLPEAPSRTRKHVASPARNSSCKRLNMYLRWMVRKNDKGVDFGIWKRISPSSLYCPLDVHVIRVAHRRGLISRATSDWKTAEELRSALLMLDAEDPCKYDFALFGEGVLEANN